MPEDRKPLSSEEKTLLREWIQSGADWPADFKVAQAEGVNRTGNSWVRRLTVPEYVETVRSAVGINIEKEAREMLPPDLRADGFNNTAYNLNIDLAHVEAYARLAEMIARRMDLRKFAAKYAPCSELSDKCVGEIVSGMGKWLFRGPLAEHEVAPFLELTEKVRKEGGDFKDGLRAVVEAMLQAPRFIYRMEFGNEGKGGLNEYELATRLSYTIWGAPPDKELMRAAEARELSNAAAVKKQARRMLKDARAIERSAQFAQEWLDLGRLANLRPNKERFPKWEPALASDMQEETLAYFKDLVWEQKRPLSELMNAKFTHATPRLAKHYGLPKTSSLLLPPVAATKADEGLVALYTFEEGKGEIVRDVSKKGEALNLKIESSSGIQWSKEGLTVKEPSLIRSEQAPKRLIDAIRKSHAVTLEAWITPADTDQSGPARIVTLSSSTSLRNLTLGQDKKRFEVRLRTTGADANGMPSLATKGSPAGKRLTHVAFTRDAAGRSKIYIDGKPMGAQDVGGDLSNWDVNFRLALANELTSDRPWRGTFHRVAIYSRALSPEEVQAKVQTAARYDLTGVQARGGLLTHASLLSIGGDDASMVTRGLFVLQDFLWSGVDDPPPCVDTTPVPTKPGLTQRAIAEARLRNASCSGCHLRFEPLAFGLEKFDGIGAYHEKDEHGNKLRDDGNILFPEKSEPIEYKSSAELMELLAGSERVQKGITRKLIQFAIGRPLVSTDGAVVDKIHETAQRGGGTYASLMTAIVTSELVLMDPEKTDL
jgi:hypothetical protein